MNGTAMACISMIEICFTDIIEGSEFVGKADFRYSGGSPTVLRMGVRDLRWVTPDGSFHDFRSSKETKSDAHHHAWTKALRNFLNAFGNADWCQGVTKIECFKDPRFEHSVQSRIQAGVSAEWREWKAPRPAEDAGVMPL